MGVSVSAGAADRPSESSVRLAEPLPQLCQKVPSEKSWELALLPGVVELRHKALFVHRQ